jgi:hypothetical protein
MSWRRIGCWRGRPTPSRCCTTGGSSPARRQSFPSTRTSRGGRLLGRLARCHRVAGGHRIGVVVLGAWGSPLHRRSRARHIPAIRPVAAGAYVPRPPCHTRRRVRRHEPGQLARHQRVRLRDPVVRRILGTQHVRAALCGGLDPVRSGYGTRQDPGHLRPGGRGDERLLLGAVRYAPRRGVSGRRSGRPSSLRRVRHLRERDRYEVALTVVEPRCSVIDAMPSSAWRSKSARRSIR